MDKLAKQGMLFTQAYAAAPVCSPYRASLMSGQYPARIGVTDYLRPTTDWHLPDAMVTLPEQFKKAGYVTGMTGKWHLSGYAKVKGASQVKSGPQDHGFDEVMISEQRGISGGSYFYPYKRVDLAIETVLGENEHLIDRSNYEAVQFIERNKDKPFFLYKSHYSVHAKLNGRPELVAYFEKKPGAGKTKNNPHLAAMLKVMDDGVGMILETLEKHGLTDKTMVIFTSDNGGDGRVTSNAPLREAKSHLYEGGIREPMIVKWPSVVEPNTVCETVVVNTDFYPTFVELLALDQPEHTLDGLSLIDVLTDQAKLERETLYWHYPLQKKHFLGGLSSGAIRQGDWKLIEFFDDNHIELYHLAEDASEKHDLAGQYPKRAKKLHEALVGWRNKTVQKKTY